MLLIVGVSLTIIFLLFKEPILWAFGASETTINYALDYLTIYVMGTLFVQIALGMNTFINTQGFAKIGMLIIAVGICIRIKAVLTLKKAFTLNVQISKEQQLITNGMYKFVRHPAYTGSILSLLGVSIALKNIPAILIVAICSFVCYQIRINVEEAVLQKYFKEYNLYKEKTYKLFPYIY